MANTRLPIPSFISAGFKELRKRLFFVFVSLVVYRIGAHITVPGINAERLSALFNQTGSGLMAYFDMVSGGNLSQFTLFAVGLGPYITVSILLRILTTILPSLEQLKKEGEAGRRKLNQYTRYGALALSIVYSYGLTQGLVFQGVVDDPSFQFYGIAMLTLVTGALFLMWLGEQITERGVGNGTSLIISAGIISGLPSSIIQFLEQIRQGQATLLSFILVTAIIIGVSAFIIFMERAQRKITVNYPQRQQGRRIYAAQTSHLPLKINMTGIMPTIFASNFMAIPTILLSLLTWLNGKGKLPFLEELNLMLSPGQPLYMLLLALAIIFFSFFYTALDFNPREMADNLKKSGAFIPSIRPGEHSAHYIDKVMTRLTAVGSIYLVFIVLLPNLMRSTLKGSFASFGGISLLIVIVVMMEFIAQIQSLIMSHQYEPLLKKAKLKGISTGSL
jgi:preprotein translocase subunit SecY